MRNRFAVAVAAGLCALIGSGAMHIARADDFIAQPANSSAVDAIKLDTFPKGLWFVTAYGGAAVQPAGAREQLSYGTLGGGYCPWDDFSFNVELTGVRNAQDVQDATGGGGDVLIRWHFYDAKTWTAFSDVGAGILETDHREPPDGTDFNFTFHTGVGLTARINDRTDLLAGVRYFHLSNAHQEGPARNPSMNAAEVYVGVLFKL